MSVCRQSLIGLSTAVLEADPSNTQPSRISSSPWIAHVLSRALDLPEKPSCQHHVGGKRNRLRLVACGEGVHPVEHGLDANRGRRERKVAAFDPARRILLETRIEHFTLVAISSR